MTRNRTDRRRIERQAVKNARERLKLAASLPGGSPERPISLATSHLVELEATSAGCVVCGNRVRCDAHDVEWHAGSSLRVARLRCTSCGIRRNLFFVMGTDHEKS